MRRRHAGGLGPTAGPRQGSARRATGRRPASTIQERPARPSPAACGRPRTGPPRRRARLDQAAHRRAADSGRGRCVRPRSAGGARARSMQGEVIVLVLQRPGGHADAPFDQARGASHLAVRVDLRVATAIEPDRGSHHTVDQVKADQLAILQRAADDELVPFLDMAGVLELVLVLVGPEGVQVVVLSALEHRPGRCRTLLLGVVVMLDPDPAEQRVHVVRHVASGEDVGHVRSALRVDEDTVVHGDTAALQHLDIRLNTDGYNCEIARHLAAGLGDGALDAAVTFKADYLAGRDEQPPVFDRTSTAQLDPMRHRVDASDRRASEIDVVRLVPVGRPDQPAVERFIAAQIRLGQRRPAKGDARFVTDENDAAVVALPAQRLDGVAAGHARPGDDDGRQAVPAVTRSSMASAMMRASASMNRGSALKERVRRMRMPWSRAKAWASTSRSYKISRWSATKPIGQTSASCAPDFSIASSRSGPSHGSPVWLADWKANSQGGKSMPAAPSRQLSSS